MPKNSMSAGHSFEIWQRTPSGERPTYEFDRWNMVPKGKAMTLDDLAKAICKAQSDHPAVLWAYAITEEDWLAVRDELQERRKQEGLPFLAHESPIRNYLVCGVPVIVAEGVA